MHLTAEGLRENIPPMTTLAVADAVRDFAGALRHVTQHHETVVLRRGKRTVAVLMPPDMAEDLEDVAAAEAALAEHEKDPSCAVPLEEYVSRREGLRPCATR
jgi:hypothetical protein